MTYLQKGYDHDFLQRIQPDDRPDTDCNDRTDNHQTKEKIMNKTGFEYLDHDEWVSKYIPHMINGNEIKSYDTHDDWETIRSTSPNLIWTWVTGDMSDLLVPGIGIVNRLQYYICEVPWTDLDEIVLLSTEEECECYDEEAWDKGEREDAGDPNCSKCEGYGLVTNYYETEK